MQKKTVLAQDDIGVLATANFKSVSRIPVGGYSGSEYSGSAGLANAGTRAASSRFLIGERRLV